MPLAPKLSTFSITCSYLPDFYSNSPKPNLKNIHLYITPRYKLEDAKFWTNKMLSAKADLLGPGCSTAQARNERFFAQENSIPLQAIRHGGPAGKFVGCTTLTPDVGTDVVQLGYYLHPAHHGKGLMTVASVAAIKWAREEFGVRRVYSRYAFDF